MSTIVDEPCVCPFIILSIYYSTHQLKTAKCSRREMKSQHVNVKNMLRPRIYQHPTSSLTASTAKSKHTNAHPSELKGPTYCYSPEQQQQRNNTFPFFLELVNVNLNRTDSLNIRRLTNQLQISHSFIEAL